ncbi:hypothetical protein [uncultured Paraglaciecola sp.]|uniref:hypothetical protein n=1 Tax=uncultured Paraglaciecola sp. TaxID=1765024 RepID=UPI002625FE5A|nr:hypothetical protein [uncultured Paraglaciecola sp.]
MTDKIIKISDDFWNIRGEFKVFGLLNIGTQASLVKLANGKFVLLDAYTLQDDIKQQVDSLTNNGADIEAIINLHPFHTIHVAKAHADYPNAKLYGTQRHLDKLPDLPWQTELTNSNEFESLFSADFEFSVPRGVDFISNNEHLHFSSVLAYHIASKTIHVDDTLMFLKLPGLLGVLKSPELSFHMTLSNTLERRESAADDFRLWVAQIAEQWSEAEVLCAAHSQILVVKNTSPSIAAMIMTALQREEKILKRHQKKYG